jgi:hypothetical protein
MTSKIYLGFTSERSGRKKRGKERKGAAFATSPT